VGGDLFTAAAGEYRHGIRELSQGQKTVDEWQIFVRKDDEYEVGQDFRLQVILRDGAVTRMFRVIDGQSGR
jgi:hypothetical protein